MITPLLPARIRQALEQSHNGLAIALLGLALGACSSSPETRYYTLASAPSVNTVQQQPANAPLWIEVGPVSVPERLNRPQIVMGNRQDGELTRLEFARWASPLPDELRDALAQQLQEKLDANDVYRRGQADMAGRILYRISIEVLSLDAAPEGSADADIRWQIQRLPDGKLATGRTRTTLPASGKVEGLVTAYRQIVAITSDEIASAVRAMRP